MPRGFLLENVKNLKTHDDGNTYKVIYDELSKLGYHIKDCIYNSLDFGVSRRIPLLSQTIGTLCPPIPILATRVGE